MQQENTRNTIIFFVCSAIILVVYMTWLQPQMNKGKAGKQGERPAAEAQVERPAGPVYRDRAEARAASPRVLIRPIATPEGAEGSVRGSISLVGGRIDDLYLTRYARELGSRDRVELFRPQGLPYAYFAYVGWSGENVPGLPNANTRWTLREGRILTPETPVTLAYRSPEGLDFTRTISLDDKYLFTITDRVTNNTGRALSIKQVGSVQRRDVRPDLGINMILHEGGVGAFDGKLKLLKYGDWRKHTNEAKQVFSGVGGWIGITDKYWMAALIPDQRRAGTGGFRPVVNDHGVKVHEARYESDAGAPLRPGFTRTSTMRLFAGAKVNDVLAGYEKDLGARRLVDAIDWGNFWFFTKPLFWIVDWFWKLVGNFGVAIILLTVAVKVAFFPLANQAFASMAKIKKLQPKQEELKKKYGDDPQKMQMEMMQLYQREKINPLAGCLPILIQIPVFYALYKVLFVTIEMRHAPFFGWIQDLSSRDPTTLWNLFGLIPWNVAATPVVGGFLDSTLHIGVWPVLYGLTMWLQTSMNPPSPDPTQQAIMKWFPLLFTVLLAQSPAGLVIYWAWSNVLSIFQQYIIMRRHKTANPIDGLIARFQGKEYQAPS